MGELVLLTVIGTSIWVGFDARTRGLSWTWALGCLALWIVAFPWYLVERSKLPRVVLDPSDALPAPVPVAPPLPPARWYPDPQGQAPYRYWDGDRWTGDTSEHI